MAADRVRWRAVLALLHRIQHKAGPDDLTGKQRMELFNMQLRIERKLRK